MIYTLKTLRYWKYLFINNLFSVNTIFIEWLSGLLYWYYAFSGWKGWNSLNLLFYVDATSLVTLGNGHANSAYTLWVILWRQAVPCGACLCWKAISWVTKICIVPPHPPLILLTGPNSFLISFSENFYHFFYMVTLKIIETSYSSSPSCYDSYFLIPSTALHMPWFSDPFQPDWMLTDRILEIEELSSPSHM